MRSSSATSYLAPKFLSRPNLHVLINSRVTRLVKTSSGNQPVAFRQVELTQGGPTSMSLHFLLSKNITNYSLFSKVKDSMSTQRKKLFYPQAPLILLFFSNFLVLATNKNSPVLGYNPSSIYLASGKMRQTTPLR